MTLSSCWTSPSSRPTLQGASSLKILHFSILHTALFWIISIAAYRNPIQTAIRLRGKKGDLLANRTANSTLKKQLEEGAGRIVLGMCYFPSQLGLPLFSVNPTSSPQVGLKMASNILELIAYQVCSLSVRPTLRWGQFPSNQMGLPEVKTVSSS